MSLSKPASLNGKLLTVPPTSADSGRYTFINLENAEPNLGLPVLSSGGLQEYFLLSDPISGNRIWSNANTIAVSGTNIGIGTDQPSQKLTVVGNISATGTIYGTIVIPPVTAVAVAGGKNTTVQFNSNGVLSGDGGFTYNVSTSSIKVGSLNTAAGNYNSILGGTVNTIANIPGASIVGGSTNTINNQYSIIAGGQGNTANGDYAVIGGGLNNQVQSTLGVIGGGQYNTDQGVANFIGAGANNTVNGQYSLIAGGLQNQVTGDYSAILGGQYNVANRANTFILGSYITTVSANYAYVNNLSSQGVITSQYVSIGTNSTANALTVAGNISASGNIFGTFAAPISAAAAGTNTQIQYNNNGVFGAHGNLTFNSSTNTFATPNVAANTLNFSSLSSLSATTAKSVTATDAYLTIQVGTSALAFQLFRYF